MSVFPDYVSFNLSWRPYQQQVLLEFDKHISDNRFHIVAAPGSGKTILGLELVRMIGKPALILGPTLTIKHQWIDRFQKHFLPDGYDLPEWVSTDIKNPKLLTVSTYQAVFSAYKGLVDNETLYDELEEETYSDNENGNKKSESSEIVDISKALKEIGIEVLVVDEAHHLKSAWWQTLEQLRTDLGNPTIIALTATPPYDVSQNEWERYKELCGPVDIEVSVPEMVKEGNLCPHQDYVCLSMPTDEENIILSEFRDRVSDFFDSIVWNRAFCSAVSEHIWIKDAENHIEDILSNPAYFSSMIIFINASDINVPIHLVDILGIENKDIPPLDLEWLEILLSNCIYKDYDNFSEYKETIKAIEEQLKSIGAVEQKQIVLKNNKIISKIMTSSASKFDSIIRILKSELNHLGSDIRMVILTDYIRKAEMNTKYDANTPKKLGVAPIFDMIRKEINEYNLLGSISEAECDLSNINLAILTGSLVVIPQTAIPKYKEICNKYNLKSNESVIQNMDNEGRYTEISINDSNRQKLVCIITELFLSGDVNVIVGTKSLLGEGWDAPCINSLVLASNVGSFVLSNQMRGRAIRICQSQHQKTANVWHLICVDKNKSISFYNDYESVVRRFNAFVGLSFKNDSIENGFARLNISNPPFKNEEIETINNLMFEKSVDRKGLYTKWMDVLKSGTEHKMIEGILVRKTHLPRNFAFKGAYKPILKQLIIAGIGGAIFSGVSMMSILETTASLNLALISFAPAIVFTPFMIKPAIRAYKHIKLESSLKEIAYTLLDVLLELNLIKKDNSIKVITEKENEGNIRCELLGGTSYERSLFIDCLEELFEPISNQRYLLVRKDKSKKISDDDYFPVPSLVGEKKNQAEMFCKAWNKHIGPCELIYTRQREGRKHLLHARSKSLFITQKQQPQRLSCWR
ncbi:MAG: DEAD/DEAH box helicase family protein [Armatimonadota bacterium]